MTDQYLQRTAAYFSVDILFDMPLDFNLEEIAEAVSADYPHAAVAVHPVNKGKYVQTDRVILGMLKPLDERNGHVVVMNGIGHPDEEFCAADNSEIAWRSGAFAHYALTAIKTHKSYMTLSVQTADTSLIGKFRAVRQLMAVSGVFAQLPICLGVLVHWSSHMVGADTWVASAQKSMQSEWPVYEWISFRCGWDTKSVASNTLTTGYTKGLRSFIGYELHLAAAPIKPSDGKLFLKEACLALMQGKKHPRDGGTFSIRNRPESYRVHRPSSANGIPSHVLVLVHPDAPEHDTPQKVVGLSRGLHRPAPDFMNAVLTPRTASS